MAPAEAFYVRCPATGAAATLTIATLSGFAAVYTERVLKRGQLRAHTHAQDILGYMQIQMALASLLIIGGAPPLAPQAPGCESTAPAVASPSLSRRPPLPAPQNSHTPVKRATHLARAGVFAGASDMPTILEVGLWYGFDRAACIAVASSALGGLIVSAVRQSPLHKRSQCVSMRSFDLRTLALTCVHLRELTLPAAGCDLSRCSSTPTRCSRATRRPRPSY